MNDEDETQKVVAAPSDSAYGLPFVNRSAGKGIADQGGVTSTPETPTPKAALASAYGSVANPTAKPVQKDPVTGLPMDYLSQMQDAESQQAYISYQRFLNYLKLGNAAQGQGMTAGDQIAAQSNYQNQLGSINSNYAGLRKDAQDQKDANAREDKLLADERAYQEKQTAAAKTASEQETAAAEAKAIADYKKELYSYDIIAGAADLLDSFPVDEQGNTTKESYDKLAAYIEQNRGKVGTSALAELEYMLENTKYAETPTTTSETPKATASGSVSKGSTITVGGQEYIVQTEAFNPPEGTSYADGEIYYEEYPGPWPWSEPNKVPVVVYGGKAYKIKQK